MIKPTHVHVIVDGKILLTGDQDIVEKIDKQGFDWVKAEYGIDVKKVDLRPSSIGLCGVKESLKNDK
jgi:Fe-S cluster assembly ATP-binding protein